MQSPSIAVRSRSSRGVVRDLRIALPWRPYEEWCSHYLERWVTAFVLCMRRWMAGYAPLIQTGLLAMQLRCCGDTFDCTAIALR